LLRSKPTKIVGSLPQAADYNLVTDFGTDQQAVETLLRLAEEYAGHGKNLAGQGQESAKGAHDQDTLKTAETDLRV
jgi:hypothetical protein